MSFQHAVLLLLAPCSLTFGALLLAGGAPIALSLFGGHEDAKDS